MADIVNLRRARKQKARADSRREAGETAVQSGRSRIRKEQDRAQTHRILGHLDQHRRPTDEG